jgi:hypothetical protein
MGLLNTHQDTVRGGGLPVVNALGHLRHHCHQNLRVPLYRFSYTQREKKSVYIDQRGEGTLKKVVTAVTAYVHSPD